MSFKTIKNPLRADLIRLTKGGGSSRALRDPATGDIYAWPASDALHIEMVNRLNLNFRTRDQVQKSSYLFSRDQLDQSPDAADLEGLVEAFGGSASGTES